MYLLEYRLTLDTCSNNRVWLNVHRRPPSDRTDYRSHVDSSTSIGYRKIYLFISRVLRFYRCHVYDLARNSVRSPLSRIFQSSRRRPSVISCSFSLPFRLTMWHGFVFIIFFFLRQSYYVVCAPFRNIAVRKHVKIGQKNLKYKMPLRRAIFPLQLQWYLRTRFLHVDLGRQKCRWTVYVHECF